MKMVDFENIAEIFDEMIDSDKFTNLDEVEEASEKIEIELIEPMRNAGDGNWMELDCLIGNTTTAFQKQGFIQGFQYAMRLKKECGVI